VESMLSQNQGEGREREKEAGAEVSFLRPTFTMGRRAEKLTLIVARHM